MASPELLLLRRAYDVPEEASILHYDAMQSPCGCFTHKHHGVPSTLCYHFGDPEEAPVTLFCAGCGQRWRYPETFRAVKRTRMRQPRSP